MLWQQSVKTLINQLWLAVIHIPTAEAYNQVNQTHQDLYLYIYCDGKPLDLAIISYSVGIETPSSLLTNQIIQDTSDLLRTLKIFLHCGPNFSTVFYFLHIFIWTDVKLFNDNWWAFLSDCFVFRLGTTHLWKLTT